MNIVLKASENKLRLKLFKTAWVPIAFYSLIILLKSNSVNLSLLMFALGTMIILGLIQIYITSFKQDVYITDTYISGPSKFFGLRQKIKIKDYKTFKVKFKKHEMLIEQILIQSKKDKCIAIDPSIHGELKTKQIITHLKSL